MNEHILKLYDYHLWANERVFQHLKALPRELHHQEIQSVFPSLYDTLAHIYFTDQVWLSAMSGDSYEELVAAVSRAKAAAQGKSIEELESLFQDLYDRYKAFFEQKQDLQAVSTYSHPQYGSYEATYSDILQHVVNHGTYHRGNITAMLRQLGHPGVPTDYIHYLFNFRA